MKSELEDQARIEQLQDWTGSVAAWARTILPIVLAARARPRRWFRRECDPAETARLVWRLAQEMHRENVRFLVGASRTKLSEEERKEALGSDDIPPIL